ncbi:MAG TPA: DUF892 family protein, partial [Solirubrobacterales bacterium]|nr:DUF892 family protein [Solirubrobacterales bacterium]
MTSRLATNPLVAGATAALFAGLSHVRRPRAFHPYGVGFRATLTPAAGADTGAVLFDRAEPWSAVVRLSRSLGLPEALHDPCGLAFRVPDAYGDGHHQDFLLISSGEAPVARHLILPSGGFAARPYSSLLPYRIDERTELVGARPLGGAPGPSLAELRDRGADGLEFAVRLATPSGEWRDVARLALGERLPTEESERLRFNPAHSGGGLEPVSFLNDLRPAAYRGSQEARRRHDGGAGSADTGSPSVSDAKEARDMPADINEQLIKHLTDVHSIEEQALTQMRQAPQIAGDPELATVFERHLVETER